MALSTGALRRPVCCCSLSFGRLLLLLLIFVIKRITAEEVSKDGSNLAQNALSASVSTSGEDGASSSNLHASWQPDLYPTSGEKVRTLNGSNEPQLKADSTISLPAGKKAKQRRYSFLRRNSSRSSSPRTPRIRRFTLILAASLVAFLVVRCARHLGLSRNGNSRLLAVGGEDPDLPAGACGGGEEEGPGGLPPLRVTEGDVVEKATGVLNMFVKVAMECEQLPMQIFPDKTRARLIETVLGIAIQEIAAQANLMGNSLQRKRGSTAARILGAARRMTANLFPGDTAGPLKAGINTLMNTLTRLKDGALAPAVCPPEERVANLLELFQLQETALDLLLSMLKGLTQPEGGQQPTQEILHQRVRDISRLGFMRRKHIFANRHQSAWLKLIHKKGEFSLITEEQIAKAQQFSHVPLEHRRQQLFEAVSKFRPVPIVPEEGDEPQQQQQPQPHPQPPAAPAAVHFFYQGQQQVQPQQQHPSQHPQYQQLFGGPPLFQLPPQEPTAPPFSPAPGSQRPGGEPFHGVPMGEPMPTPMPSEDLD